MKRRPSIPQVFAYVTLEDVVGYAVAMSQANVVVPMVLAAQPTVATNVAKRQQGWVCEDVWQHRFRLGIEVAGYTV